jgi:hypothetical protein
MGGDDLRRPDPSKGETMKITESQIRTLAQEISGHLYRRIISMTDIDRVTAIEVSKDTGDAFAARLDLNLRERNVEIVAGEPPKEHKYFNHPPAAEKE